MAAPATKTNDIKKNLVLYLRSEEKLTEFQEAKIKREIASIPVVEERAELLAFLFAAAGKEEQAIAQFKSAISSFYKYSTIHDYCLYLLEIGQAEKHKEAIFKYADELEDAELVEGALNIARIYIDEENAIHFAEKLAKYSNNEASMRDYHSALKFIDDMKSAREFINCSTVDMSALSSAIVEISSKYKIPPTCSTVSLIDDDLTVVVSIKNDDADLIADMNFDLAMRLAQEERLLNKPLSAWFRHDARDEVAIV